MYASLHATPQDRRQEVKPRTFFRSLGTQLALKKDALASIQSAFTILAFITGFWWFVMQSYTKPIVRIEHKVIRQVSSAKDTMVWVEISVTNVGKVPVDLETGCVLMTVQQQDSLASDVNAAFLQPVKYDLHQGESCPSGDKFVHVIDSDAIDGVLLYSQPLQTRRLKRILLNPGETDQSAVFHRTLPHGMSVVKLHSQYKAPSTLLGFDLSFLTSHFEKWDWVNETPILLGDNPDGGTIGK